MDKEITVKVVLAALAQAELYQEECRVRFALAVGQVRWLLQELDSNKAGAELEELQHRTHK